MNDSTIQSEHTEHEDSVYGDLNRLNASLENLDERGLILSLAAFAEDVLGTLLKAFMLPTDATMQLLEGFNAPLGTFSSRIKAAYSLGLIAQDQFEDLEHLRKIRNEFAHSWKPISMAHPRIAGHIKAINYSNFNDQFPETPFEKVRTAVSSLLVELRSAAHLTEKHGRRVQVTGRRLVAGFPGSFDQQLEAVRRHLATIDNELSTATGEKREFFQLILKRLIVRLTFVDNKVPKERHAEILELFIEITRRIAT